MHLAVMAAICGATDVQPGSIVQAVIRGGTDMMRIRVNHLSHKKSD